MAKKEKELIGSGNVKIIDAQLIKEGVSATGRPGSKCKVTIMTKNGPSEFTSGSKAGLTLIGKTANVKLYSTTSQYGTDKEIEFVKQYSAPLPSGVDLSEINKKLDRILKILADAFD